MKNSFLPIAIFFLLLSSSAYSETTMPADKKSNVITVKHEDLSGPVINYAWATKRLNGSYWGIASGDVDGDGAKELLLLSRRNVKIFKLGSAGELDEVAICSVPGVAEGTHIYTMDLDGDKLDEILVSAVEEGLPASFALKYSDKKCRTSFDRERLSLRVAADASGAKKILGEGWLSSAFFSGSIYELNYENGKLKVSARLDIPRYTNIFQFAELPAADGARRVALIKGYNPLEVHEKIGKRFKRIWRTGERFGGSVNLIRAPQREAMGEVTDADAEFDLPPIVVSNGSFLAVQHNMPLRGAIGRRPMVRGAEISAFRPDAALGYGESYRSIKLPGAVVDYYVEAAGASKQRLVVLMQDDPSMFREGDRAVILAFDLP